MSQQVIVQKAHSLAGKHGIDLGQIQAVVQYLGQHPEVAQVIQLVAQLRGNPQLLPQIQAQGRKILIGILVQVGAVNEYVLDAMRAAGLPADPLVVDLEADVHALLAKYGTTVGDTPAPAPGGGGNV